MPELSVFISMNELRYDSVYLLTQGNQELITQNILLFHPCPLILAFKWHERRIRIPALKAAIICSIYESSVIS